MNHEGTKSMKETRRRNRHTFLPSSPPLRGHCAFVFGILLLLLAACGGGAATPTVSGVPNAQQTALARLNVSPSPVNTQNTALPAAPTPTRAALPVSPPAAATPA